MLSYVLNASVHRRPMWCLPTASHRMGYIFFATFNACLRARTGVERFELSCLTTLASKTSMYNQFHHAPMGSLRSLPPHIPHVWPDVSPRSFHYGLRRPYLIRSISATLSLGLRIFALSPSSRQRDLNPQPTHYRCVALPLRYGGKYERVESNHWQPLYKNGPIKTAWVLSHIQEGWDLNPN